ncbi:hypothetical protein [Streptomyces griseorubiginosus]|uniref:hypothetical protein n=1 Tax=Streptomyces griseorubiginosus TaxID=67304 RepID=UPI001AD77D4D|nr:hypothetical protein [Streptomyces griseorubiginosus]MBO4258249.1 hypothetical protein [Streptomyces griseorubiginosus]
MVWYGLGPHPGICTRHATAEQKAASTAALDVPVDIATADPATVFPGVSITPQRLIYEGHGYGWVAKIRGTNKQYVYARTFLNRTGPPYGWLLPGTGLYECREIGPLGKFSCFFEVKGAFRRKVRLVSLEEAARMASRMGPRPSE